jgi:GAF domain-containing protein
VQIPGKKKQLIWIFLLVLVAMGTGFFVPISTTRWIGYGIKSVLFLLIFVILYVSVIAGDSRSGESDRKESDIDTAKVRISDDTPKEGEQEEGFGDAFRHFYQEFVGVVRSSVVASWAGIYLRKGDTIEFLAGESKEKTIQSRMILSDEDIITRVADGTNPVMEGNLPIGMTFTGIPHSEMRSFLGIPILMDDQSVGVLAVGSEATESFGIEDQEFLTRCGKILVQVMAICRKGLHWETDQGIYRILIQLEKHFETAVNEESILSIFIEGIKKIFSFDRFTFCTREGNNGIIRFVHGIVDELEEGYRFPLDEGLTGWILKRNAPLRIDDMEEGDYIRPRYSRDENPKHGLRSFLGIPMGREGEGAWACVSLESKQPGQYSEKAKDVLSTLLISLQLSLERIRLNRQIQGRADNDPSTLTSDFQSE